MDIATLGISVNSSDLKKGTADLERFGKSGDKASIQLDSFAKTAARAALRFAGVGSAALAAGKALGSAQAYVSMTNSLRAMGLSGDQAVAALDQVAAAAQRTRAPLEATAQLYQRISIAGRDLGASSSDVLRFTENVSLALAQTGGSAASASGALTQLSQAMSGGTVRAEEFNSILEGAFPIAQAAANAIDGAAGSVGRLRNMVVEGKVSSKEFFDAIISQTAELEAAFANTVPTIGQAVTVLGDTFTVMSGKMDATLGISSAIAKGILVLADNLDRVAIYAATAALIVGGQFVVSFVAARGAVALLTASFAGLKRVIFTTGIGAIVVIAGELVYRFSNLVKATGSFGDALELLKDVAIEVFGRIGMAFDVVPLAVAAGANKMAAVFYDALRGMMIGFQDLINTVVTGLNSALGTSLSTVSGMGDGLYDMANAASAAATAASGAGNAILGAVTAPLESIAALREVVTSMPADFDAVGGAAGAAAGALDGGAGGKKGLSDAAKAAKKEMADAAQKAKELADEIERLEFDADPIKKYNAEMEHLAELSAAGLSDGAYAKAVADLNDELAQSYPLIGDVSDAFGDFVAGGLSDFKGFVSSILGSFKSMLSEMIATAARNKIMLSMGIGGGGVGAAASAMGGGSGIGGILGGIGSSFMGGASGVVSGLMSGGLSGGLGAVGTSLAGATAGLSGLAAAAGAVALPLAAVYGAFKFFTGSTKELDAGIRLNIEGNELLAESYKKVQKSRFFGLSKSTSENYSPLENTGLSKAYASIYEGAEQAAWALGLSSKALKGYTDEIKISTKGMDEAQAQAAVMEALQQAQNGIAGEFFDALGKGSRRLIADGEELGAAMQRVAATVQVASSLFDVLKVNIDLLGLSGAKTAAKFVDALGGLDAASGAVTSYINAFYSDAERATIMRKQLTSGLNDLGIKDIPGSLAKYRAKIDRALNAGNTTKAAKLISFAPAFAEWKGLRNDILDAAQAEKAAIADTAQAAIDLANKLRDALRSAMDVAASNADRSLSNLRRAIDAQKALVENRIASLNSEGSRLERMADASRSLADNLMDASEAISNAIMTPAQEIANLSSAMGVLRAALATGAAVETSRALEKALDTLTGASASSYGSEVDFKRQAAQAAYLTSQIADAAISDANFYLRQLAGVETQIGVAQDQLAALEATYVQAAEQLDTLKGIQTGVLSIPAAMAALVQSMSALQSAQNAVVGVADGTKLYDYQKRIIATSANGGALKPWELKELAGLVPGYANGTDFAAGGLSMVGERGPELVNLPRGSQVSTNAETRKMGSDTAAMRAELQELKEYMRELVKINLDQKRSLKEIQYQGEAPV